MSKYSANCRPVVAIVDAVSAGALVTQEMAGHYDLIHIESDVAVNALSHPRFHKHHFKAFYHWDRSQAEKCLEQIALHNPLAIIPGHESAVKLSEKIAWSINGDGNDPATTVLRRNKFLMNEAVGRAGLKTVKQAASDDPCVLKNWFRQYSQSKVVVKPLDSAGSDDVYICTNEAQVEDAARTITSKINIMHNRNEKALIQQFIEGKEHVVNTVSLNGKHKVTDVWRVSKKLSVGRNLYDFDELCPPQAPETERCIAYTLKALDAIGIVKGAGHTELILSPDGPTLIEVGARVSGAANPEAIRVATGSDQLELIRYAYTCPESFYQASERYQLIHPLRCVHAIASQTGPFSHAELRSFLETLPGFVSAVMKIAEGARLKPTTDVYSCPAAFFLTGISEQDIAQDYVRYRQWEAANL